MTRALVGSLASLTALRALARLVALSLRLLLLLIVLVNVHLGTRRGEPRRRFPLVATRLHDRSDLLASLGRRDTFPLPHGRGDEVYRGSAPAARSPKVRDIHIPDLSLEAIRVRTRDFR